MKPRDYKANTWVFNDEDGYTDRPPLVVHYYLNEKNQQCTRHIAQICKYHDGKHKIHAQQIAAVPELLEACKLVLANLNDDEKKKALLFTAAAIRKAEGL